MGKNLVTEAERYLSSWRKDKRRSQVLRIVGVLVVFATVYALILPAVTMSNEVECGMVEHIHTESCWEEQLVWPQPRLVCAVESSGALVLHTHDSYCYNDQGELICTLPEVEAHVHGPECYQEQRTLICDQVADPGHQHTASCYTYVRVENVNTDMVGASGYTCGFQEGEGAHIHTEECYPEERAPEPLCGLEETADEYDGEGNLIRQGHTHTEECWMVRVHEKLICGQEETEDVYDEEGSLIQQGHHHTSSCWLTGDELCYQYGCGQHESAGHIHTDACSQGGVQTDAQGELWEQVLTCGEEEREPGHVHTDECYLINQVLTCHMQELEPHTHGAGCYDENGVLICGKTEIVAHQHTSECFVTPEGGQELIRVLVCGMEEHTHTEDCYVKFTPKDEEVYYCGLQEHVHTMPDCYFESGELKCTLTEHVHDLSCLQPSAEESEEPEGSQPPDEPAAEGVELANAEFTYANDAFTMTFTVNGFAQVDGGQADPELPQGSGSGGDPAPAPTAEALVEITNQMVPLAALPRMMSFTMPDSSEALPITDEYESNSTATPGLASEPGGTAVDNSSQPALSDPVLPVAETQPAESQAVNPSGAQEGSSQVEFSVEEVFSGEEYDSVMAQMLEVVDEDTLVAPIQVMALTAAMDGQPLDLAGCQITVQVQPSQMLAQALSGEGISTMSLMNDVPETVEDEETPSISLMLLPMGGDFVEQVFDGSELESGANLRPVTATYTVPRSGVVMYSTTATFVVNPEFTVQFYANLNVPESTGGTLPFINTMGKNLPQNGTNSKAEIEKNLISLALNSDGSVDFKTEVTEIYKEEIKEFNPKLGDDLNIDYLNSLRDNKHYEIKSLWVLKDGGDADSTSESDWETYSLANNELVFTNNPDLAGQIDGRGRKYIVVDEDTVMRLVYDPASDSYSTKGTFYDFDISDGPNNATKITTTNNGINSTLPTSGSGQFAFGNNNAGTRFGTTTWNNNNLNMTNKTNSYAGCTFGLVSGITDNGDVQFSAGVIGPKNTAGEPSLFGEGDTVTGRTVYPNWNLNFDRQGDTFTLESVSMDNNQVVVSGMDKFKNPQPKYPNIWTNNFWPMDGEKNSDPQFGGSTTVTSSAGALPPSDDGKAHNSYFGMKYSVGFDLMEEYVGPLEYYFYGDDDLWVFLDGTLVCDIGGVHSSVGEYVDLWDYIPGGRENHEKGQHTLSIFYTERGASGSTCWMQFTLPQISEIYNEPYDPDAAGLTITKQIAGVTAGQEDTQFPFELTLSGIYNNYEVRILGANGVDITQTTDIFDKNDQPLELQTVTDDDGTQRKVKHVSAGSYSFKLKGGEKLEVIGLPSGTSYTVEEKYSDTSCITDVNTEVSGSGNSPKTTGQTVIATGTLNGWTGSDGNYYVDSVSVTYTNTFGYVLPETGGTGPQWYTMAGVPLTAAMFCLWYKKKTQGEGAEDRA